MKRNFTPKGKVALFDPFLDTLGGGEKHILSILKVLDEAGFAINIFWDNNLQKQIQDRFQFEFKNKLNFLPNIFIKQNHFGKLITIKQFDFFFYVTDGSYFFSSAKKNFVFSMVPDIKLYRMNFLNRLKLMNYKF